jgi:hypothetical protein
MLPLRLFGRDFVAEILEDETAELKGSYDVIMQWYAARLLAKAGKSNVLDSPNEGRKKEVRLRSEQDATGVSSKKRTENKSRQA